MFLRELPVDSSYARLRSQVSRFLFFTIFFGAIFLLCTRLFGSDITWSWDGFDPILGEHSFEGLALSILTSGLETLPNILVAGGVVKKNSTELKVLWSIAGCAYAIDISTNYLGLSTRQGRSEWGLESNHVLSIIIKALLSVVVGFMEIFVFWFLEATVICFEAYKAAKKNLKGHSAANIVGGNEQEEGFSMATR